MNASPDHVTAAALVALGAATLGESGGHAMRSRVRADTEDAMFAALRSGRTTVELLDLDPSGVEVAKIPPSPQEAS
jgi:hypothetical protein